MIIPSERRIARMGLSDMSCSSIESGIGSDDHLLEI
jgi:hypothetical protein